MNTASLPTAASNVAPSPSSRLVVVSYRLPFHVEKGRLVQNSGGLVSAMLAYARGKGGGENEEGSILWLGVSQDSAEALKGADRSKEQQAFDLVPLSIPEETQTRFYEGFSNNLVWPLFHYFPNLASFNGEDYAAYKLANQLVARQVSAQLKPGDRLWIHDYHFLPLPRLLRENHRELDIGFFLHIPFPSFEIFRLMPRAWAKELVQGMLGSDLVGFHTYDYVQHFTQCAIRLAGAQSLGSWLATEEEGYTRVEAFPIGIDANAFARDRTATAAEAMRSQLREAVGERSLIFSVDRLDYTKGLLNRLLAFEQFLLRYPQWKNHVVFNMVVVPSRDTIPRYQEMKAELEGHVGRINGLFATLEWRPVVYQYRHLDRHALIALYDLADVGLITPLRDGMNLVSKEFVASQPPERPGVLILSEMAGAASELREALLINPNDSEEMVNALRRALEMGDEERLLIWGRLKDRVFSYDVFEWATDFLSSLESAAQSARGQRTIPMQSKETELLRARYLTASSRTLLLDYDGTLVPFHRDPDKAIPGALVHEVLSRLGLDPRNRVTIISGRSREFLERWFADLPVGLVAEHGAFQRKPGGEWETVWEGERGWKQPFLRAMRRASHRCPGSQVEEKNTSLVWHYRNADPIHGLRVAQELREDLEGLMRGMGEYRLVEGNHILELRPASFDKGTAAIRLLGELDQPFVLAIGDDRTDEDLFSVVPKTGYAIKVGRGNTLARYHLRDPGEVLQLLGALQ